MRQLLEKDTLRKKTSGARFMRIGRNRRHAGVNAMMSSSKEISILGANRFDAFTKTRAGSRAVTVRDGMILLSHETVSGWWLVPGGGLEAGETPEACCVRETEEETGLIVKPLKQFLTLYEYYEEYRYISNYFKSSLAQC